jgi:hypothetical protein
MRMERPLSPARLICPSNGSSQGLNAICRLSVTFVLPPLAKDGAAMATLVEEMGFTMDMG